MKSDILLLGGHLYLKTADFNISFNFSIASTPNFLWSKAIEMNKSLLYYFDYPVVQTNGSSLSSTGSILFKTSNCSIFSFKSMWQRLNTFDISGGPFFKISVCLWHRFCRSVSTVDTFLIRSSTPRIFLQSKAIE